MPDLLLELFSEEIPARMQQRASKDFSEAISGGLIKAGLTIGEIEIFSGPRRIAMIAKNIPSQSPSTIEERKGPRVGSPEKAINGFLKAAGLSHVNDCEIVDDAKGAYYIARFNKDGRATDNIVAELVPSAIRGFSWPKSMRWGGGALRWIRPLHSILALFDDKPIIFDIDGITSGNTTQGHRFYGDKNSTQPKAVLIKNIKNYTSDLTHVKVVSARELRAKAILEGAEKAATNAGLVLVEDHGLLDENAGLVEWPVVLFGRFDKDFLEVPEEILMTSMKAHQKCFSVRKQDGGLAEAFILVSNLDAKDGGQAIIAGNERVIRARLSDAKFFWDNDKNKPLSALSDQLQVVTFHEKLGTQFERVNRIRKLAEKIAPFVHAPQAETDLAAHLCKADLMSETVGEFPELQGIIGRYIAIHQGCEPSVAQAIADHYKPMGPNDSLPSHPISIVVALADKIDMLTGFWLIDEKPTGSKDPFALRRAALGIIRIILEGQLRLPLPNLFKSAYKSYAAKITNVQDEWVHDLEQFFMDRLKVYLKDKGTRYDLIDAVFAISDQIDLLMIVNRVNALSRFLETKDGQSILVLIRRALNILKIEEKKDNRFFDTKPDETYLNQKEEKVLYKSISIIGRDMAAHIAKEDYEGAMTELAKLRAPVDLFFEKVTVNADKVELRQNRLSLLNEIRILAIQIADFSKVEIA